MSGVITMPVTARARLVCDRCGAYWESRVFRPVRYDDQVAACSGAFDLGWRVFVGERTQRTYCPSCGPTVPMRQVYPRGGAR